MDPCDTVMTTTANDEGVDPCDTVMTTTANGDIAYTAAGVGAPLVALFVKLVRNLDDANLEALLRPVLDGVKTARTKAEADSQLLDLFLLIANTRGVRGGKGKRAHTTATTTDFRITSARSAF